MMKDRLAQAPFIIQAFTYAGRIAFMIRPEDMLETIKPSKYTT